MEKFIKMKKAILGRISMNKQNKKIIVRIYIKNKIRPLIDLELDSVEQVDSIFNSLSSDEKIVVIGQLVLNKDNFSHAIAIY